MQKKATLIPISQVSIFGNEERYVLDALRSSWISSIGKYIDLFENKFAEYIGNKYAVSVSNGTVAIQLALRNLNIGQGDEVIVPSFTFASTVNAIIHVGATPVLIDSLPYHWNMDPEQIEKAFSPSTKAIIPVHLYGHPCDMENILKLADKYGLYVIEDAAEALGAECLGKKVGCLGHIGCFSFYGNKVITTGEGGMCVTNDPILDMRMRKLRDHGMNKERRYWHDEIGYNFRLTNLNAAIGVAQLEQIDVFLKRRYELANFYSEGIKKIKSLTIYPNSPFGKKIDWMLCVFIENNFPFTRDQLIIKLKEYNIDARPTFYPVHIMPPYSKLKKVGDLKNSLKFGLSGINLPLYPSLSLDDVQYIIDVLKVLSTV